MSPTQTADVSLDTAIDGLAKRMAGKTPEEQAKMLADFSNEHNLAKMEERAPEIMLTDEQLTRALSSVDDAKKVAEEAAATAVRRYKMDVSSAQGLADDTVSKEMRRKERFHADCVEAAKVFRAIARSGTGRAKPAELHDAYSYEKDYLQRTGREVRNLDVGTGSEGGFMSPEIWNTMLYENLARVSLLRKYAYWFQMESNIMRLPKITANMTANTVAELAGATGSQPTFAQATWTIKKLTALTNPFSIELFENARPELVQMLTNVATIELNRKEDEICFNTSDAAWSDLLDSTTNRVYLGSSSSSGKTTSGQVTFDDMAALIFQLAEQYVPDEDVQGSGMVGGGVAQFWVNKSVIQSLLALKGTTNQYIWGNVQDLQSGRQIYGHPVRRVLSLPASATAATQFACFGNLNYRWVGYKNGFMIDLLSQGNVGAVNLNTTSSYALRINELLDVQTIDDQSFSRLSTSAT
jgi:HK97 family phage major capsid protein